MTIEQSVFQAGVVQTNLAASAGLNLSGYAARQHPASGVHDPVFVRALAMRDDNQLLILLAADALGFERPTIAAIRQRTAELLREKSLSEIGERAIAVMIAGTHTHSAPATMTLHGCGVVNDAWLTHCIEAAAQTAARAVQALQPARIGFGRGVVQNVAINRRDAAWTGQAKQAQDTLPLDEELGIWRVESANGQPLACVVNFACHPVVLTPENREVSADYVGVVCAKLHEELGVPTLFLNGAAADINPARRGAWDDVEWTAAPIVAEAKQVWQQSATSADVVLDYAGCELHLPWLPLPESGELQELQSQFLSEKAAAQQNHDAIAANVASAYLRWSEAALQAQQETAQQSPASTLGHDIELQVFRVGEAALVAVPAEFFVSLGLQIKAQLQQLGFKSVLISGYTNGNLGYVPDRAAYPRGGYEVNTAHRFYGHLACVAPEAGEAIVQQAARLASSFSP